MSERFTGADIALHSVRHNTWATRTLLEFCADLSDAELHEFEVAGTHGRIYWTLQHFVVAEGNYRQVITGEFPAHWGWHVGEKPTLGELDERAQDSGAFWEELLSGHVNGDETVRFRGVRFELGAVLAQALHHGNHHRSEVCVVLTQLGKEPADLSGLGYGEATGAIAQTSEGSTG